MHCVQNSDPSRKEVKQVVDMSKNDRSLHAVRFEVVLNNGSKRKMPACAIENENPKALREFFEVRPDKRSRYNALAALAAKALSDK